jgi:Leucine-rich repeat (LRR) protein
VLCAGRRAIYSTLPSEIGLLTTLAYLDLSSNEMSGSIVQLSKLIRLINSNIDRNSFSGSRKWTVFPSVQTESLYLVPSEFGALSVLKLFDFSFTGIESEIPSELGLATSLTFLQLTNTALRGTLPSQVTARESLSVLVPTRSVRSWEL